jgi:hypothetical protein
MQDLQGHLRNHPDPGRLRVSAVPQGASMTMLAFPPLVELLTHAGLDDLAARAPSMRVGLVEFEAGQAFRASDIHRDEQDWRRKWAAYMGARSIRKPINGPEDFAEWHEWGMRQ